jgi:glycine/D-amino acid oxidase-like deaminating enzyme
VVIGGGAVGAACAASMAGLRRRARVLHDPQRRTTEVSGGHLLLQSKRPEDIPLARESVESIRRFAHGREAELGYRCKGSLLVALDGEEAEDLRRHFWALAKAGVPMQWMDHAAAHALEPELSPELVGASFCPLDAQIHPTALAESWLRDAEARGASIEAAVAEELRFEPGSRPVVSGGGRTWEADAVVLAGGVWSGALAATAGVDLGIVPRRGVLLRGYSERLLASRPILGASYLSAKFGADPRAIAFIFQQHPSGECVLGGSREDVGFSEEGIEAVAAEVLALGTRYLPALAEVRWDQVTCGFRPWMPSGGPRIGACEVPGLFLACGHEGDGITLSAATGQQVAGTVFRYLDRGRLG